MPESAGSDVPTARDFPDCRACQMWEDAGASWPRPCKQHYGGEPTTAGSEPRYARTDEGALYCEDCGVAVVVKDVHTRFHSILSSHGWTLAVLQNTHLSSGTHDRYDAVERIKRRKFDNWSADAFAEVVAEREALDGT